MTCLITLRSYFNSIDTTDRGRGGQTDPYGRSEEGEGEEDFTSQVYTWSYRVGVTKNHEDACSVPEYGE